jgi:hypothetical protein
MSHWQKRTTLILSLGLPLAVAGCGTGVPGIQEFWGGPEDTTTKIQQISFQAQCEIGKSLEQIFKVDADLHKSPDHPRLEFIKDNWAVQVNWILIADEKSTLTPSLGLTTPFANSIKIFPTGPVTSPQSFSLGLGGIVSSEAIKNYKLNYFYKIKDLVKTDFIHAKCLPDAPANASLFVQSDLQIYQFLAASFNVQTAGIADYYNVRSSNGLVDDIKFEIVTNGNVTPTWKLVNITNSGSAALFAMNRDRTQEVIVSFGPIDKQIGTALAGAARDSSLAAQIGAAVNRGGN